MSEFTYPEGLIDALRYAQRVMVLTGAGISAESGIPTFRDAQTGLWARYKPEDLATPHAFQRDPRLVWEWYAWRRQLISQATPNPGHLALVTMEARIPEFSLITQNVDGLHQAAGSQRVIELHGNIHRNKCFHESVVVPINETSPSNPSESIPPTCPRCGGPLRPDVVWFGESLPEHAIHAAWDAAQTCQMFFSIGTSAMVQPAASLPLVALEAGATVIEINPDKTPLTSVVNYSLQGPAGIILPGLVQRTWVDAD